ncbi:MAG: GIY-YIG nuclease family protein [Acidobacteria bacterium]|nr:MAG: GIY-YIG nuclease family protein [Acidobacteriota bacterium]REK04528.1 MAG: GIY-YIG nuclease family protein [Acidobacteriota bacterium]
MSSWFLYLVRTERGALYTGVSTDVQRRLEQHDSGRGAKSLRGAGALRLAFCAEVGERARALSLEARVKRLGKAQKERLVAAQPPPDGLNELLEELSGHRGAASRSADEESS